MFSGEAEIQARRKTLAVLQDEVRRVLDASRELVQLYTALSKNDAAGVQASLERIRKAEEDTEQLRRMLTRELAEIGTMIINREDFLGTAYNVEEMAGYTAGVAFKPLSNQVCSFQARRSGGRSQGSHRYERRIGSETQRGCEGVGH